MTDDIKRRLLSALPRHLVIDLLDMAAARTLQAHELIRDGTDLDGRSARALEGQARFRLMEKGFQTVCEGHGGIALEGGVIPNTDLRFFQPFIRFGGAEPGVVLGLASMPARHELPAKNQSRNAGVSLNYHLTPRLDLDDTGPKPGDIFVLFLVARDPARAGKLEEVAIGIIDAEYASYLFYEPLETFIAGYADGGEGGDAGDGEPPPALVTLKRRRQPYKPPEDPDPDQTGDA